MPENHPKNAIHCRCHNKHINFTYTRRITDWIKKRPWMLWLLPVTGLISLLWFLIRVVPKPSRACYPCQRIAAPLAGGFVVWIGGLICSTFLYQRARKLMNRSKYILSGLFAGLAVLVLWIAFSSMYNKATMAAFSPSEASNNPIGIAKGLNPGRVTWAWDPNSTSWDGLSGYWWDDNNTSQTVVDRMVSRSIRSLSGRQTDKDAWDALFRDFNRSGKLPDEGYKSGEKIAIKINCNQDRSAQWGTGRRAQNGLPSPHVIDALITQLISNAGVPGEDITIYEVAQGRNIGDPIYKKIRANPNPDFQAVKFVVNTDYGLSGRLGPVPDMNNPIHFAQENLPAAYLPTCVTEAKYLINLAILRPHSIFGITLCAKNHFGSLFFPNNGGWTPSPLHGAGSSRNPMDSYNCLVDLIGHRHLGGKTLLYMVDGLYPTQSNEGNVMRFASFGDDWASSIFMSQDPIAIDSVCLDFLRNEPRATNVRGNCDNYIHEAALADKPPSGTVYDPEGDGIALKSLGVHEHWNNPKDRKYSRNLGTSNGIELISLK